MFRVKPSLPSRAGLAENPGSGRFIQSALERGSSAESSLGLSARGLPGSLAADSRYSREGGMHGQFRNQISRC
jgi:hypothetical protein